MLTSAENEMLTRVSAGQPAGELLRRYWLPVGVACELSAENPTQLVRILGETLVLFRDTRGRVGLLDDRCSHRGASLCYGRVEERGIACPYHGWLYDTKGNCLETPAEPPTSKFHLTVKHQSYPVHKLAGLYWAYLGPEPAPLIPNFDIWFRKDGRRKIFIQPQLDCNWFQAMENSMDPAHLEILHQITAEPGRAVENSTRGLTDDVSSFDFYEVPYGLMKRRIYKSGMVDEHPVISPISCGKGIPRRSVCPSTTLTPKSTLLDFSRLKMELSRRTTKCPWNIFDTTKIRLTRCIPMPSSGWIWCRRKTTWHGKLKVRSRIEHESA